MPPRGAAAVRRALVRHRCQRHGQRAVAGHLRLDVYAFEDRAAGGGARHRGRRAGRADQRLCGRLDRRGPDALLRRTARVPLDHPGSSRWCLRRWRIGAECLRPRELGLSGRAGVRAAWSGRRFPLRSGSLVECAVAAGNPVWRVLFVHLMPNTLQGTLAQAAIRASWAVRLSTTFAFLGLGIQPPTPEWGAMIRQGAEYMVTGQ